MKRLRRSFYGREADVVARELLGMLLVRTVDGKRRVGRIVETEAYMGEHDKACHTSRGITERTKIMFGPPGFAYVYMIYGMYYCMNVVTGAEGCGAAVLLRALEPFEGLSGKTCGPGLLSRSMGIGVACNGLDLLGDELNIVEPSSKEKFSIARSPRVGVDYAGNWAGKHLRFYIKDSKYVSKR